MIGDRIISFIVLSLFLFLLYIFSFESDNNDKKHHNKSSTRYKRHSVTSIENTNMKEKEFELCDKKMFIEKNVKDGLREDSFLKQYGKLNDKGRLHDCSPVSSGMIDSLRESKFDETSEYNNRKRTNTYKSPSNSPKKKGHYSPNFEIQEKRKLFNSELPSRQTCPENNDSIQIPSCKKDNPHSIPTLFSRPPPSFTPTVFQPAKTVEELEYEKAVDTFIQNTKKGLIKGTGRSQSRKYYDKDGNRIYHPDDPRSKYKRNENNISCNKDKNLEDVEKSNQKLSSSGKLPDNEEDKIKELDKVYKKENFHNSFSQDTQQNMLDEIGKLSKAINLDELDKRYEHSITFH